jgi:hypothetical protein
MGIEEGENVQAKGIHNIFSKTIAENFPNLEKATPIQLQEAYKTPNRHKPKYNLSTAVIVKTDGVENKERILRAVREKKQITYKSKPIQITDFSTETMKERRAWSEVF